MRCFKITKALINWKKTHANPRWKWRCGYKCVRAAGMMAQVANRSGVRVECRENNLRLIPGLYWKDKMNYYASWRWWQMIWFVVRGSLWSPHTFQQKLIENCKIWRELQRKEENPQLFFSQGISGHSNGRTISSFSYIF